MKAEMASMEWLLLCASCGRRYPLLSKNWRCSCGSPLTVKWEEPPLFKVEAREHSLWRYHPLLPASFHRRISLGEGLTPTVRAEFDKVAVLAKLEYLNPTGSFKDRGASLAISHALEVGARCVVEDSSGNAGAAIAAYASAAGLKARIYVPQDAPQYKKNLISAFQADIIEKQSRSEAAQAAIAELGKDDLYVGHLWNPFFIEGTKTIAFELYEQIEKPPNVIIAPTAAGTLLLGLYKGFNELIELGLVDKFPRLYAVQAAEVAPLYEAIHRKPPPRAASSLADGLRVSNPPHLKEMVHAITSTHGGVCTVDNSQIQKALKTLHRKGFLIEPTSATALAALWKLEESGEIAHGERILLMLTGSGLKAL